MNKLVDEYNQSAYSSTAKTPDKMISNDEIEYIADKNAETLMKNEVNKFNEGDHVRMNFGLGKRKPKK